MPLILWTQDLAVGDSKIDDQHKQLFAAADNLAEAMWAGKGAEEIAKTIEFLQEYTIFHFGDEESTMTTNAYPGYDAQKAAHERFKRELSELKAKHQSGAVSSTLAVELLQKSINWFRDHIRAMDQPLGKFLKEKGVAT